jgi:hypothetical protein
VGLRALCAAGGACTFEIGSATVSGDDVRRDPAAAPPSLRCVARSYADAVDAALDGDMDTGVACWLLLRLSGAGGGCGSAVAAGCGSGLDLAWNLFSAPSFGSTTKVEARSASCSARRFDSTSPCSTTRSSAGLHRPKSNTAVACCNKSDTSHPASSWMPNASSSVQPTRLIQYLGIVPAPPSVLVPLRGTNSAHIRHSWRDANKTYSLDIRSVRYTCQTALAGAITTGEPVEGSEIGSTLWCRGSRQSARSPASGAAACGRFRGRACPRLTASISSRNPPAAR